MGPTDAARVAEARQRRDELRDRLLAADVDVALVTGESNVGYLTAYSTPSWANGSRPICLLVDRAGTTRLILSDAEVPSVTAWDERIATVGYSEPSASLRGPTGPDYVAAAVDAIAECLAARSSERVATELSGHPAPGIPRAAIDYLRERLRAELVDLGELTWPLRMRKSPLELDCLRAAAEALARAFGSFAKTARPGMSELRLQAEFAAAVARSGADRLGYAVVVAGARRPLLGPPTERIWERGELLLIDAGVVKYGYWADYCRCFCAGTATAAQRAAYARLVDAVRAGREAIAVGVTVGRPAAAVARAFGGAPASFGRVGHGIGLDIAEPPSLHPGDPTAVDAGMALCVEPSAHFDRVGHLVAEEMVTVGGGGAELLSPAFPEHLEELG